MPYRGAVLRAGAGRTVLAARKRHGSQTGDDRGAAAGLGEAGGPVLRGGGAYFHAVSVVLMGQRWRLVLRGMGQPVWLRDTTFTHLTSVL